MRNISDKNLKKFKTHILHSDNFFFRKTYRLRVNVEKYGRDRQATDENMTWRRKWALHAG